MKRSNGLTVALLAMSLLVLSSPAAIGVTASSNWTLDQLQPAGPLGEKLAGIAAISSSDVWVVGTQLTSPSPSERWHALIEHWDGSAWTVVPPPSIPWATSSSLNAVTALSSMDVWALGQAATGVNSYGDPTGGVPLALHWDGSVWSVVSMPIPGGSGFDEGVFSASFSSADDGWAVGNGPDQSAFTEHWDGASWSVVANPAPTSYRVSQLYAVTDISPTDAWAVGDACGGDGCSGHTLFLHWDGTTWVKVSGVRSHGRQLRGGLLGITAVGPTDVWAVGETLQGLKGHKSQAALAEHWDGTGWTRFDASVDGQPGSRFLGVTSTASGQVWAAGWKQEDGDPLLQRWDGKRWRNVGKAEPIGQPWLSGVSALSTGDTVWAVGSGQYGSLPTTYYVEHSE